MNIILWIVVLIIAIFALVKASDLFVDGAESAGVALGLPSFVVGVLIVGVGTSLPELVSSFVAVQSNASEIVIGNVLGSNITNIFLVLGIAVLISKKFVFKNDILSGDIPILLSSAFLLYFMIADSNFTLGEGIFSLVALSVYIIYTMGNSKDDDTPKGEKISLISTAKLLISPIIIYFGAKYTVEAVIKISEIMVIGKDIIALTAVALGTSLPEVMVSINAAKRGNGDMVVGNIIGSNIFNTFAVMGIPALVGKIVVPNDVLGFSLPLFIVATIIFTVATITKRVPKWVGGFMVIFYLYFLLHTYKIV